MKLLKILKAHLLKQIRLVLLQKKIFIGRYADVYIAAQQFVSERNILVQHFVIREKNMANTVDETLPEEMKEQVRKDQEKELKKSKDVTKGKKMIVWYGQDTLLHRWLGFKVTWYHVMLAG